MIELVAVTRSFGPVVALDDFTLTVRAVSVTVLLGPNGAGQDDRGPGGHRSHRHR